MSGTTISNLSTVAVALTAANEAQVMITTGGTIAPSYAYASAIYVAPGVQGTITNYGLVSSQQGEGIFLTAGGTVTNGSATAAGATIEGGSYGIRVSRLYPALVTNFGTITTINGNAHASGIQLGDGGTVVNGSNADTTASISGYRVGIVSILAAATVANFGTISAFGSTPASYGIYLRTGGAISNGSNSDTTAQISGYYRAIVIAAAAGTIDNFGTIKAHGTYAAGGRAIALMAGGTIVNGSSLDTTAYIYGKMFGAVGIKGSDASANLLVNYGTIVGAGTIDRAVNVRGGSVVNGSNSDVNAKIIGTTAGVVFGGTAASTAANYGTIIGSSGVGVCFQADGQLTNGSSSDTEATILANRPIYFNGGAATISNFGTIADNAGSGAAGITMMAGGALTNGSPVDWAAVIYGGSDGVLAPLDYSTFTNFGTISGVIGVSFYRVNKGFTLSGDGTITNAGLIESTNGTQGVAVRLGNGTDRVVVDQGGAFIGHVQGGAGTDTLELAAPAAFRARWVGSAASFRDLTWSRSTQAQTGS